MTGVWGIAGHRARCGLALVFGVALASAAAARDRVDRYGIDGWIVTVRQDAFTGSIACYMHSADRRMTYLPGAVGFAFGRRRDTLRAWYRLDGGPALRWQDRYPALSASGAAIDGPGLDDPTGGIVWLPEGDLAGVREVAIRPTVQSRVRVFRLRGFAELAGAARRLGCWRR